MALVLALAAFTRPITTDEPAAQRAFDEGMLLLYGFDHNEAAKAFARCAKADRKAAMCRWGLAVSAGPHINHTRVEDEDNARALTAFARIDELNASDVERALIDAQKRRFAKDNPADRAALDRAYADAMRAVAQKFPADADVQALFAEALLDLRPWDQWTHDGKAQPGTDEIVQALEHALVLAPDHPLANHLYIHALEASPTPEKADVAADRLRTLAPTMGHLVHMPSHIDVRRGRWARAIEANQRAIEADEKRMRKKGDGFYRLYIAHDFHMLSFAAMMSGRERLAITTMRALVDDMPASWRRSSIADNIVGLSFEVLVRFGKWDEVLREKQPASALPISRALHRYARGVAFAAKHDVEGAKREQAAFALALVDVPAEAMLGTNVAKDALAVAGAILDGEIALAAGALEDAHGKLARAAELEDALRYDEPPGWMMPARHPLGAVLLRMGKAGDAERVFREDLARWPDNVWSLWGLATALKAQGKGAADVELALEKQSAGADVKLTTSCLCVPGPG